MHDPVSCYVVIDQSGQPRTDGVGLTAVYAAESFAKLHQMTWRTLQAYGYTVRPAQLTVNTSVETDTEALVG